MNDARNVLNQTMLEEFFSRLPGQHPNINNKYYKK